MKSVLLIGPYNKEVRTGQYLSPPLGIHRIASYLENRNLAIVDVVDPSLSLVDLHRRLRSKHYDIVGHSLLHPTIKNDIELMFVAREEQPNALQIAGGQGASFNSRELLEKTPLNAVARGFGEFPLERIIESEGKELENIPGLYVKSNGNVIATKLQDDVTEDDFRRISNPIDFSKMPYERYWQFMASHYDPKTLRIMKNEGLLRTVRLMTSNYCPMGCTFCSSTNFLNDSCDKKQKLRQLRSDEIITLMKYAAQHHPETEAFYLNDDDFMLNKERTDSFCHLMQRFNGNYNLMCMGRVDDTDKNTLKKMKKAGFKIIFYGVETFSDQLARDIRKSNAKSYSKIARTAIEQSLEEGITPQISLMLFLPSSRMNDLEKTVENTVEMMEKGAIATVFPYVEAYPGSEIMKHHEINYNEFEVRGIKFKVPYLVLPNDRDVRRLAEEALAEKDKLNREYSERFKVIPQPIDNLNLFSAVYRKLGKDTGHIERAIKKFDSLGDTK